MANKPGDLTGQVDKRTGRVTEEMHFEDKTPLILSECPWKPPKSLLKDKVEVTLDDAWSEMRTEAMGRRMFSYRIWNESKGHEYSCELFEGIEGEPVGRCNCPSATPCKHMIHALKDLLEREPTYGDCQSDCEFMVGVRSLP